MSYLYNVPVPAGPITNCTNLTIVDSQEYDKLVLNNSLTFTCCCLLLLVVGTTKKEIDGDENNDG